MSHETTCRGLQGEVACCAAWDSLAIYNLSRNGYGEMRWLYTINRTLNNLYLNNGYMIRTYNRFDADFEEHRNNVIRHQIGFVNDNEDFHDAEEEA